MLAHIFRGQLLRTGRLHRIALSDAAKTVGGQLVLQAPDDSIFDRRAICCACLRDLEGHLERLIQKRAHRTIERNAWLERVRSESSLSTAHAEHPVSSAHRAHLRVKRDAGDAAFHGEAFRDLLRSAALAGPELHNIACHQRFLAHNGCDPIADRLDAPDEDTAVVRSLIAHDGVGAIVL